MCLFCVQYSNSPGYCVSRGKSLKAACFNKLIVDVNCLCFLLDRGGLVGILNVLPWRAPSWENQWISMEGVLISAFPIMTMNWLSLR